MGIGARKNSNREDNIIDVDASMQGSLVFKDQVNLRIRGSFEGSLETKGKLTIGETAIVTATIKCENIIVEGRVKGDIDATSRIELSPSAVIDGTIKTPNLVVHEGAILQGKCTMMDDVIGPEELARHLDIDKETVISWADTGKIPGFKEGEKWKFERKRIDNWVASGKIS